MTYAGASICLVSTAVPCLARGAVRSGLDGLSVGGCCGRSDSDADEECCKCDREFGEVHDVVVRKERKDAIEDFRMAEELCRMI